VRSSALFAELDEQELDQRLRPIHNGMLKAGAVIYRPAEAASAVFTVRCGVIKLLGNQGDPPNRIVRLLGRGAAIGLEALDGAHYEHTAVATREANICRIPARVLRELGEQNPRLAAGMVAKWREHARWSEAWISTLYGGKLEQRARALVRLLVQVSGDPPNAVKLLRIREMADVLGVSQAAVSRCLADLKRRGLLERVGPWTYNCHPSLLQTEDDPAVIQRAG
jgi:CRP-like cAMP-binding protein